MAQISAIAPIYLEKFPITKKLEKCKKISYNVSVNHCLLIFNKEGIFMKRKLSKLISILMAVMICGSLMALPPITADQEEVFGEGLIPESEEELQAFADEFDQSSISIPKTISALPTSVDLSTSPCFPPIGNQGGIGSCTAWASTYYQYSYEVNKLNNVTSTEDRVIYSPKWTYNNINHGSDSGSSYTDAYRLLKNQGALTQTQFPYPTSASSSNYNVQELPTYAKAVSDMRDALNTRLTYYSTSSISGTGTVITSNSDSDLTTIKNLLNSQKVLTFQTWNEFNYKYGTGSWSSTKLAYRCYDSDEGCHAMTLVGYNDNVTCDINGNGVIEEGEKGAFKVINSWGLNNSGANNNGVIWIMYDALNGTSANNLNESSFSYTRKRAMGTSTNNVFNVIYVGHKDVSFVAEVSFSTNYRNQVKIELGRGTGLSNNTFTTQTVYSPYTGYESVYVPYNGTMVFDFGNLANPISNYYSNYYWRISISDITKDNNKVTYKGMKITDEYGNIINSLNDAANAKTIDGKSYAPIAKIDLEKGDMNYNRSFDYGDYNILGPHIVSGLQISYLQNYLGDLDNNGKVEGNDLGIMQKIIYGEY